MSVVNDSPDFLELMKDILEADDYDVSIINGEHISSIEPIRATQPELLIVDLRLSQAIVTGWDIAKQIRADPELARIPMILCTGAPDEVRERAAELAALPGVEVLAKPFAIGELESMVARLLMADRDAGQPQERNDFEKTIERSNPNEVERAGPPLQKHAEGENAGDHSDTRVVQPGEEPPPEADRL